jgi:hypothetical protein
MKETEVKRSDDYASEKDGPPAGVDEQVVVVGGGLSFLCCAVRFLCQCCGAQLFECDTIHRLTAKMKQLLAGERNSFNKKKHKEKVINYVVQHHHLSRSSSVLSRKTIFYLKNQSRS